MNRTARSLTTLLAAPIVAAGVFATSALVTGTATAHTAGAETTRCASMAMPKIKASPAGSSMLTRAGQIAMVTPRADSGAVMDVGC